MWAISVGHHVWFGHAGATKIKSSVDSMTTFCRTFWSMTGGGNAYIVSVVVHEWDMQSTPAASKSCSQL